FSRVQSTYLSIFAALGALGLLLGSAGMGLVAGRNVFERRSELALLSAVGLSKSSVLWMVLAEHWGLLLAGVLAGTACAAVAVGPALAVSSSSADWLELLLVLVIIAFTGIIWTSLATWLAIRGRLTDSLRDE
ncbi:MAG TPA: FtsX-like permease family protein, partial [Phycisphaerae bacterium]|nr:FtsX-like permease family protein [Phycisphaerae bacterium]